MLTATPESPRSSDDVAALVARVADLEESQRAEDVEAFVGLFRSDAVWVTGGGVRLIGRDAIGAFTRTTLPGGMGGGSVQYTVEHVLFISPDVALTGVNQEYLGSDGRPLDPPSRGLPSYIWVRSAAGWHIAAGQNTAAS